MPPSRSLARALGGGGLASLLLLAGCPDAGDRVYTAAGYSSEAGCLQDYAPLGLVVADDLRSTCEPACLSVGGQIYVSTVCPPYPPEATVLDPKTDDCRLAAAELEAGAFCSLVTAAPAGGEAGAADDAASE